MFLVDGASRQQGYYFKRPAKHQIMAAAAGTLIVFVPHELDY
jgi:hypothetical protein